MGQRFPDFIIGGAMKSGTTSLHRILASHPKIYLPPGEIHFFSVDDISEHPDFFYLTRKNGWAVPDLRNNKNVYKDWYCQLFDDAREGQFIGEDSTTYLPSKKAAGRIAETVPNAKLVFILRNPVDRTYSHYWHLVRTGRATYSFENQLRFAPTTLITRSFYAMQLKRYFNAFHRSQIKVVIFEEFISDPQSVIDAICGFLGLGSSIDVSQVTTHVGASVSPRWMGLQLMANRVFRELNHRLYAPSRLPHIPDVELRLVEKLEYYADRSIRRLNMSGNGYPSMKSETRAFLEQLFARENQGLDKLIDRDVKSFWSYMEE